MTIDSFLSKNENVSGFKIGQIIDAQSQLWRIKSIFSRKSEFDSFTRDEINE